MGRAGEETLRTSILLVWSKPGVNKKEQDAEDKMARLFNIVPIFEGV